MRNNSEEMPPPADSRSDRRDPFATITSVGADNINKLVAENREKDAIIAQQQQRIEELEAQLAQLQAEIAQRQSVKPVFPDGYVDDLVNPQN